MRVSLRLIVIGIALLFGGAAWGQEPKGWLGAELRDVTKEEADRLGWDAPRGAVVAKVPERGSPAEKAGLKAGDIILAVDRTLIETSSELAAAIAAKRPGAEVRLQVLYGGRERRVTAMLAELPRVQAAERSLSDMKLMVDTGGHRAHITDLTFTPDGKHIVSASEDKVIRVWDAATGKTVRTLRGQVGTGPEGKIFAMALSPDGKLLAAAGWAGSFTGNKPREDEEAHKIRLYDFATGELTALLKGHTGVVTSLAFSSDGRRLISGSGNGDLSAIIWDLGDGDLGQAARSARRLHTLAGHKAQLYAVGFTPDGQRAVTGSLDHTLRLWSVADGKQIATMEGHRDKVLSLAISPADDTIASGSTDGEIRLWDGKTGRLLKTLAKQGAAADALAFSPDGKFLLSGAGFQGQGTDCHVWDVATGKELVRYTGHDNIVIAAAISPDGRRAATGGGNQRAIHVWNLATGTRVSGPEGKPLTLGGIGAPALAAGFSADGRRIAWGNTDLGSHNSQREPYEFQLRLPDGGQGLAIPERIAKARSPVAGRAADPASPAARQKDKSSRQGSDPLQGDFVRARTVHGDLSLTHRPGGRYGYDNAILDIRRAGTAVASIARGAADGYGHWAYSFTPDGQTIISGGANGEIFAHDLSGKSLGEFKGHEGVVQAVTPSPDGRYLVSGSGDQTIRLWNLKTRELIVTLFHGTDGDWVLWTPQGYYTGSPGADSIVGWQINKGPDKAADYVGAEQLRQHLNRPDIVERAIVLASAEQAVREAQGTTFTLADLLARVVPRFRIVAPLARSTERGGRTAVKIAIEPTPDPIKAIRVQVNGRQVVDLTPPIGSGGFSSGERILDVPLGQGRNEVRISLTNAVGDKAESVTLTHDGEGNLDKRGTLYILAIGVDEYPGLGKTCGADGNASCDLRFASADARRLAAAAEKRLGPAHANVVKRVLVNGAAPGDAPTAANIIDAIDVLKQARETDTVLLFIAGHGVNDGPNYRFLATNAEHVGGGIRGAYRGTTVVPWQILQEAVETAKGRRVLFVDTCHSGNAYNQRLGNAAYHANIIAYTAARFDQEALEDAKLGHGLFTYAVVEGLDGKGGLGAKRQISTRELADYVVKRVAELAKALDGEQEPQYFKGRDAEDYVLAKW